MKRKTTTRRKPVPKDEFQMPADASEFGRHMVELSRKARAEAPQLLSVAEINKEVARQRLGTKNETVYE